MTALWFACQEAPERNPDDGRRLAKSGVLLALNTTSFARHATIGDPYGRTWGWLEHGDSEQGLELLEGLVKKHPEQMENHLRLAEAYISLGDPAPAAPYLCRVRARRAELRKDDQTLLDHLFTDAGNPTCPGVPAASSPPAAPAAPKPP